MKKAIRLLALLMAMLLLFSVVGCKSNGDEWEEFSVFEDVEVDGGETLTSSGSKKVVKKKKVKVTDKKDEGLISSDKLLPQEELFAKSNLKGTKLTYVTGSEEIEPQVQYSLDMLKNKWGVDADYVIYSNSQLPSVVATMVASGNPPDVAHVADTDLIRYAYTNLAIPIDDYIVRNDPVWDCEDAFNAFTFNGKLYGMPWNEEISTKYFVWYNKTYLKEVGAEDPYELYKAGKWDVDAYHRVAKKAVKFESDGKTVKTYGSMCWNPSVIMAFFGERAVTEQSNGTWKVTIDSAAGMEGLQLIHDMCADNSLKLTGGYKEFGNRQTAMIIERDKNAIGNYDYYNVMEDEIGMVPLPSSKYGSFGFVNTDGCFILKGAKNPIAAVAMRYYDRLFVVHTSDAEKKAAGYEVYEKASNKISDEHKAIALDFEKNNCTAMLDSKLYALTNWTTGEGLGSAFWKDLTENGKQPAQLVDSVKSQIKSCLKNTVGASNVVN